MARAPRLLPALRAALVTFPVAALALHPIDSADIWFHLATGDLLARTHTLPAADPFGAAPVPRPWIVHDWLGSSLLALVHRLGGGMALTFFGAALIVGALALPLALAVRRRRPGGPYAAALLLAALIAYERFFVRPELFTLLAAAIWSAALVGGSPRTWRGCVGLAMVQVAWTNLHAAFVVGPVLAALAVAGDVLEELRRRTTPGGDRGRWRWFRDAIGRVPLPRRMLPLAAIAACFVNPYGPRLLGHMLRAGRELGAERLRAGVVEWQPTFAQPVIGNLVLMMFVVSLVVVGLAVVVGRRSLRAPELLIAVAMIVLACSARRHLALYAVVVPPLAATWLARHGVGRTAAATGRGRAGARLVAWLPVVVALLFTVDLVRGDFYARFGPPRRLGWGFSSTDHPIGAGEFAAEHGRAGPVFTNIAAGSYLVWRLQGTPPVLIDGRLLDAAFFARYRRCLASPASFDSLASERAVQLVVLALQPFPPARLFRHLMSSPSWELGYVDGEGAAFVRLGSPAAAGVSALALDAPLPEPVPPPTDEVHLVRACDPGEAWSRGQMLLQLGYPVPARADLARARLLCPGRWDIGQALGLALVEVGRAQEAAPLLAAALRHTSGDATTWLAYGTSLAALGDSLAARAAWQRAASLAPNDPRPARLLRGLR